MAVVAVTALGPLSPPAVAAAAAFTPQAASEEEREHAELLMEYQNVRGGRVRLASMLQPEAEFNHDDKVGTSSKTTAVLHVCGCPAVGTGYSSLLLRQGSIMVECHIEACTVVPVVVGLLSSMSRVMMYWMGWVQLAISANASSLWCAPM